MPPLLDSVEGVRVSRIALHGRSVSEIAHTETRSPRVTRNGSPGSAAGSQTVAALVAAHGGLVRALASKARGAGLWTLPFSDLIEWGSEGLLQAAGRFDPERGIPFDRFASGRVWGAIFDGARAAIERGRREASHEPVTAAIPDAADQPDVVVERRARARKVRWAVSRLPEQQRRAVQLADLEDLGVKDTAAAMSLSVPRVSNIRRAALDRLADLLAGEVAP